MGQDCIELNCGPTGYHGNLKNKTKQKKQAVRKTRCYFLQTDRKTPLPKSTMEFIELVEAELAPTQIEPSPYVLVSLAWEGTLQAI